jgi:DNA-binding ferritin-like protein (Dps family)
MLAYECVKTIHVLPYEYVHGIKDIYQYLFNLFTADVAIMRLLGSVPMSHLCDQKRRSTVTGLSDLMTLVSLTWGVYITNRRKEHSMFSKTR